MHAPISPVLLFRHIFVTPAAKRAQRLVSSRQDTENILPMSDSKFNPDAFAYQLCKQLQ